MNINSVPSCPIRIIFTDPAAAAIDYMLILASMRVFMDFCIQIDFIPLLLTFTAAKRKRQSPFRAETLHLREVLHY